jgi:hypothetical protein
MTGRAVSGRPGLLVTGLPRSGTSWVGKMLEAGREVVYVNEPLNPQHPPGRSPGVLNAEVAHRFQYICADNDEPWARAFHDTLRLRYRPIAELRRNHRPYDLARMAKYGTSFAVGRARGRRALVDDPFAVLSAAWFAECLGCQVVVLVRHPLSFVGSWQRLGWRVRLSELLDQPLLMRDLLGPYQDEMRQADGSPDRIAATALLWRITYSVLGDLAGRAPDLLALRRYEDLASNPLDGFRELYQLFGLTWTEQVHDRIRSATAGGGGQNRAHVWSLRGGLSRTAFRPMDSRAALAGYRDRLTAEEIDRVRDLTADTAKRYYSATGEVS